MDALLKKLHEDAAETGRIDKQLSATAGESLYDFIKTGQGSVDLSEHLGHGALGHETEEGVLAIIPPLYKENDWEVRYAKKAKDGEPDRYFAFGDKDPSPKDPRSVHAANAETENLGSIDDWEPLPPEPPEGYWPSFEDKGDPQRNALGDDEGGNPNDPGEFGMGGDWWKGEEESPTPRPASFTPEKPKVPREPTPEVPIFSNGLNTNKYDVNGWMSHDNIDAVNSHHSLGDVSPEERMKLLRGDRTIGRVATGPSGEVVANLIYSLPNTEAGESAITINDIGVDPDHGDAVYSLLNRMIGHLHGKRPSFSLNVPANRENHWLPLLAKWKNADGEGFDYDTQKRGEDGSYNLSHHYDTPNVWGYSKSEEEGRQPHWFASGDYPLPTKGFGLSGEEQREHVVAEVLERLQALLSGPQRNAEDDEPTNMLGMRVDPPKETEDSEQQKTPPADDLKEAILKGLRERFQKRRYASAELEQEEAIHATLESPQRNSQENRSAMTANMDGGFPTSRPVAEDDDIEDLIIDLDDDSHGESAPLEELLAVEDFDLDVREPPDDDWLIDLDDELDALEREPQDDDFEIDLDLDDVDPGIRESSEPVAKALKSVVDKDGGKVGLWGNEIAIEHPLYSVYGRVEYGDALDISSMKSRGQGASVGLLQTLLDSHDQHGLKSIDTYAAAGDGYVGYKMWPKLGFDTMLIPGMVPEPIAEAMETNGWTKVSDFLNDPKGWKLWKDQEYGVRMHFDMAPGSESRKQFERIVDKMNKIAEKRKSRPQQSSKELRDDETLLEEALAEIHAEDVQRLAKDEASEFPQTVLEGLRQRWQQ